MKNLIFDYQVIDLVREKGEEYEWKTITGLPFWAYLKGKSIYCQPVGKVGVEIYPDRLKEFISVWHELGYKAKPSKYKEIMGSGFGTSYIPRILDECYDQYK